ncbi:ArsR/SmtB family transcription factor [Agromyces sp. M3QZ16-3]|uniref:ArsR/SmtB family transcription factor n=1 Tax=Agromyces sp. M3QZ16-3 TaxID=3447585 RepID=UPI003F692780
MFTDASRPLYEVKANLFKGLAHPLRVRVLEVLAAAPDADTPVAVLLEATGLEASHLSQHLAVLRNNRLVTAERRGNQVSYRLAYPQVADLLRVARALLGEILQATERQLVEQAGLPDIPARATATDAAAAPIAEDATAPAAGS